MIYAMRTVQVSGRRATYLNNLNLGNDLPQDILKEWQFVVVVNLHSRGQIDVTDETAVFVQNKLAHLFPIQSVVDMVSSHYEQLFWIIV